MFIGRTDAEAETPIFWPPDAKSWLIGKDPDAGRDWGQGERGTTEDEMTGWHHRLDVHEFEWTPGAGDRQGGLVCCDSWGRKELDTTEQLNWTELNESKPRVENPNVKPAPWPPILWSSWCQEMASALCTCLHCDCCPEPQEASFHFYQLPQAAPGSLTSAPRTKGGWEVVMKTAKLNGHISFLPRGSKSTKHTTYQDWRQQIQG